MKVLSNFIVEHLPAYFATFLESSGVNFIELIYIDKISSYYLCGQISEENRKSQNMPYRVYKVTNENYTDISIEEAECLLQSKNRIALSIYRRISIDTLLTVIAFAEETVWETVSIRLIDASNDINTFMCYVSNATMGYPTVIKIKGNRILNIQDGHSAMNIIKLVKQKHTKIIGIE